LLFEYVALPDSFTQLLRANLQSTRPFFKSLGIHLQKEEPLAMLIEKYFTDIDHKGRVEYVLRAAGWNGIRNRLASIYIFYQRQGRFPTKNELALEANLSDTILDLETKGHSIAMDGISRLFLLGLYLELASITYGKNYKKLFLHDEELWQLIARSKKRLEKTDWFLVQLVHFKFYLGYETLKGFLDKGASFDKIMSELDESSQAEMIASLLKYGSSTGDSDVFTAQIV